MSSFLTNAGVEILICGGIGGGAQTALAAAGIQLFGGVSGDADEAVKTSMDALAMETAIKFMSDL